MRSAAASETVLAAALRSQRASPICSLDAHAACALMPPTALRHCFLRRRRHVAGSEQTSRPRRVRARLLSCAAVLHAPASCCFERDPHDEERSRWTERVRFADLAFSRRRWTFEIFADVELITGPEIVLEERVLVLAPGLYFCKRSPGPPSSGRSPDLEDGGL